MSDTSIYNDEALLEKLKAGHEWAFTRIYERYWQKLYVVAYRRLGSKPAAEDVVHEVFASLWKNKEQTDIRSLYAYLSAATRYAVFNELAKYEKQIGISLSNASVTETTLNDAIDFRFLQQMITGEVNRLPEKCKLVFQYSRQSGLSNKQIAKEMGISEKSVEKHITKALTKLRLQLKHYLHLLLL
ncbi:RNA polymerase sigma-70 factor [Flavitalea flava]